MKYFSRKDAISTRYFTRLSCEISTKKHLNSSDPHTFSSFLWAFRLRLQLRRRAFRSIFAPLRSAKDAAAIPNALGAPELRLLTKKVETHQRHIIYLLCRMIRLYKFPDGNKLNEPNKLYALRFYSTTGRTDRP